MKIKLVVHATQNKDYVVLKELNATGRELINKLFKKKREMEEKNKHEYFLHIVLDLRYQARTFKQNNSVWVLVTAIFESMEGRLPDEGEKYCLYLDLLEEYADKVPSRFGGLRPVHISEANSVEGARFIDGLIFHLSKHCDFNTYDYVSVADAIERFQEWRGGLEIDPLDYADIECTRLLTENEWREKNTLSAASGRGGDIVLHHIVTRGSNKAAEDKAWNWLALLDSEHKEIHSRGDDYFLSAYPHLKGRFEKAKRLASGLLHGEKK